MSIPTASTQYNDFVGTAAIDTHAGTDLHNLAKTKSIDTKRYFPIGLGIHSVKLDEYTIFAVDTNVTKSAFENIADYAKKVGGDIPVVEFHFSANWDEIQKYIKRLDIIVYNKIPGMTSFHKIDEERID